MTPAYIEVVVTCRPDAEGDYFTVTVPGCDDPTAPYNLTPDAVSRLGVPLAAYPLGAPVTVDLDYLW